MSADNLNKQSGPRSGLYSDENPWADPEGEGQRIQIPPEKSQKYIGFLTNTGPDSLKNHKDTKPTYNVGPSSARQQNVNWRFAGGPWPSHSGIWILSSTKKTKQKKNVVKAGSPLTKLSGSTHETDGTRPLQNFFEKVDSETESADHKKATKLRSIEKVNPSTMTFVDSFTQLNDTVTGFEGK